MMCRMCVPISPGMTMPANHRYRLHIAHKNSSAHLFPTLKDRRRIWFALCGICAFTLVGKLKSFKVERLNYWNSMIIENETNFTTFQPFNITNVFLLLF